MTDAHITIERLGFGIRPAVLVGDMSRGYTDTACQPEFPYNAGISPVVINNVNHIIGAAGTAVPVYFSTIVFTPDQLQTNLWVIKLPFLRRLQPDAPLVHIHPALRFDPARHRLFTKQYPSAFSNADFAAQLKQQEIDTLIITGCNTSGCVGATAVDCLSHTIRPLVVADAITDRDDDAALATLRAIDSKYGDHTDTIRIVRYLHGQNGVPVNSIPRDC